MYSKGETQRQVSIPPSLVTLDNSKALTSNCFYLLKFLKRIKERNKDTSLDPFLFNFWSFGPGPKPVFRPQTPDLKFILIF